MENNYLDSQISDRTRNASKRSSNLPPQNIAPSVRGRPSKKGQEISSS